MLAFPVKCQIPNDRTVLITLPETVQPGEHELLIVIDQAQRTAESAMPRRPGSAKGSLVIQAEDDEHLADFADYMV